MTAVKVVTRVLCVDFAAERRFRAGRRYYFSSSVISIAFISKDVVGQLIDGRSVDRVLRWKAETNSSEDKQRLKNEEQEEERKESQRAREVRNRGGRNSRGCGLGFPVE
ncbi:hypothetical protein CEXT_245031 [Caerostris extrusa]|uniref:Uncharacterized protein n=1 Tax=Caerostris extrusa TaxID=172846 RepID=A0AAV4V514_CAEEX|nr:hypothetical protein CEXT_245031 [Caerostris extrusa]